MQTSLKNNIKKVFSIVIFFPLLGDFVVLTLAKNFFVYDFLYCKIDIL